MLFILLFIGITRCFETIFVLNIPNNPRLSEYYQSFFTEEIGFKGVFWYEEDRYSIVIDEQLYEKLKHDCIAYEFDFEKNDIIEHLKYLFIYKNISDIEKNRNFLKNYSYNKAGLGKKGELQELNRYSNNEKEKASNVDLDGAKNIIENPIASHTDTNTSGSHYKVKPIDTFMLLLYSDYSFNSLEYSMKNENNGCNLFSLKDLKLIINFIHKSVKSKLEQYEDIDISWDDFCSGKKSSYIHEKPSTSRTEINFPEIHKILQANEPKQYGYNIMRLSCDQNDYLSKFSIKLYSYLVLINNIINNGITEKKEHDSYILVEITEEMIQERIQLVFDLTDELYEYIKQKGIKSISFTYMDENNGTDLSYNIKNDMFSYNIFRKDTPIMILHLIKSGLDTEKLEKSHEVAIYYFEYGGGTKFFLTNKDN